VAKHCNNGEAVVEGHRKATIEKADWKNNVRKEKNNVRKEKVGSETNLGPHDAGFDFRFPDHIGGFQTFNADLAMQGSAFLPNP
jgi:hypothetical protein